MDYWHEAVSIALEEAGVSATAEQLETIAGDMEVCHENYGMAHGHDCIPNPLQTELDKVSSELDKERSRIYCETCHGKGYLITYGGTLQSESECWRCHGEGRYIP